MNINEALNLLAKNGYKAEPINEGVKEWVLGLSLLAAVLGLQTCNGTWTNNELKKIQTKSGSALDLYKQYNTENWSGVLSEETGKQKAIFGAVLQLAQEKNMDIAEAAKLIKSQFAGDMRNAVSLQGLGAKITSVYTSQDDDGQIVVVSFKYRTGNSDNSHYVSSEVIIPSDALAR